MSVSSVGANVPGFGNMMEGANSSEVRPPVLDRPEVDKPPVDHRPMDRTSIGRDTGRSQVKAKPEVAPLASKEEQQSETQGLKPLVDEVNQSLTSFTSLRFSVDGDLEKLVVSVVDKESEEVVRQFPSEEMLVLAKQMRDLEGILFDAEA